MSKSLVPIETIADDICVDLRDSTSRYKFSIMRKLMEGYRELHIYVDQEFCVKTAILAVDNVVSMPKDFVMETKVGVLKNGVLAVMTLDTNIRRETLTQEQTEQTLNTIWNGGCWGEQYTFYNCHGGVGEMYGMGGVVNCNGYYNIDRKKGEILIGSLMPVDAEIVVEYKSDGISDGLTLVPIEQWRCLKFYAKWQYYADINQGLAEINQDLWEKAYNKLKSTYNYRTALFMGETAQSMYKSSPR